MINDDDDNDNNDLTLENRKNLNKSLSNFQRPSSDHKTAVYLPFLNNPFETYKNMLGRFIDYIEKMT